MKKALITGQDGSYLANLLLKKGYEVHGIIRRASTFNTVRRPSHQQSEDVPSLRSDSVNLVKLLSALSVEKGSRSQMQRGGKDYRVGFGRVHREFLHVDDFADACVFLLQNYKSLDVWEVSLNAWNRDSAESNLLLCRWDCIALQVDKHDQ